METIVERYFKQLTSLFLSITITACAYNNSLTTPDQNNDFIEIPEEELLDIDIGIFFPLQDVIEQQNLQADFNIENIRFTESLYITTYLSEALKDNSQWGVVRINPHELAGSDLVIMGEVIQSDGQTLSLKVKAIDASERIWVDKTYTKTLPSGYTYDIFIDPFNSLYNEISQDVINVKKSLLQEETLAIRQLAKIRFGQRFARDSFSNFLDEHQTGRIDLIRLPAQDDPIFKAIETIELRNDMYIDLLQPQYLDFVNRSLLTYFQFRMESFSTTVRLNIENASPNTRRAMAQNPGLYSSRYFNRGINLAEYSAALAEVSKNIELRLKPQTLEFKSHLFEISGSVDNHYLRWQEILKEMYEIELGLMGIE